jgi:hypothetical protein
MAAIGGFAQDGFVLAQLAEDLWTFAAKLVGVRFELADEGIEGVEAVLGAIPLRRRKALEQVGIAAALLDEKSHGVFVGGEEFEQGFDAEFEGQLFDGALVAGEDAAVHIDVVARVFALDHDVHRGCHWDECSAGRVVD